MEHNLKYALLITAAAFAVILGYALIAVTTA
ncbi:hypothetical protein VIOR3934_16226 [Vibrio orientalis CIP 102891 = ATCC 33934]|jgi:hypothetical protein|uniref:YnhF family membrane protein n=1 Tax=Vibrio orientalis CIP 102891 = ATCC 33934 TaxID=675816 RepID=F9SPL0_VIBOR|nr:YnhF family membrane protein [Vibrio orientalis]EGU52566.1 hypothetical protein VIOR3934_16226 [Vibrio orientalis CIP 102891 = ATCC 33934]